MNEPVENSPIEIFKSEGEGDSGQSQTPNANATGQNTTYAKVLVFSEDKGNLGFYNDK